MHLVRWKKPAVAGRSIRSLLAVSVATLLGGVGFIPASQYFSPLSVYYTLGLGLGLLAVYLLLRAELELPRSYDLLCRLMQLLYTIGLAMVLAVGSYYLAPLGGVFPVLGAARHLLPQLCRHHFGLHPAGGVLHGRRSRRHLFTVLLWCAAMFFSGSRSALLFGAVMVLLGFVYLVKRNYLPLWSFFVIVASVTVIMALFGSQIYDMFFGARGDRITLSAPRRSVGCCWIGALRTSLTIRFWASAWATRRISTFSPGCLGAWCFTTTPFCRSWAAWASWA